MHEALKDERFKEARINRANRLLREGLPASHVRADLKYMLEDYREWLKAKHLKKKGRPLREIGYWLDRHPVALGEMLRKDRRPRSISSAAPGKTTKPFSATFGPDLAFLSSLYNSKKLWKRGSNRVSINQNNEPAYSEALAALSRLGVKWTEPKKGWATVNSTAFIDRLEALTVRRRAVPLKHLKSIEEMQKYLRGQVISKGYVKAGNPEGRNKMPLFVITVNLAHKNAVLLFPELGMAPKFSVHKTRGLAEIYFTGNDLKRLAESGLLSDAQKAELHREIKKVPTRLFGSAKNSSLDDIEKALAMKENRRSIEEIQSATGIGKRRLDNWFQKREYSPKAVQRLLQLYGLARQIGFPTDAMEARWPHVMKNWWKWKKNKKK